MPADEPISTRGHVPVNTDPIVGGSRLLGEMRDILRLGHYRIRTEQAYLDWSRRYILFHHKRHPKEMGEPEIVAFLNDLAVQRNVAASTQNQALNALIFLYKKVFGREQLDLRDLTPARRPEHLPTVFERIEIERLFAHLQGVRKLIATLLYGAGLRLLEDGYDIRTVQELLGHSDVRITMIYTHVMNKGLMGGEKPAHASQRILGELSKGRQKLWEIRADDVVAPGLESRLVPGDGTSAER